jgi:hypothetical protein
MTIIRIGSGLRDYLIGTEPDREDDIDLYELVDYIQGHPKYPAGIDLPEQFWSDVAYYADLLLSLEPSPGERRACNAALEDLRVARSERVDTSGSPG